jgi:hypothetical protein
MDLSPLTQLMWSEDFFFRFARNPSTTEFRDRTVRWLWLGSLRLRQFL